MTVRWHVPTARFCPAPPRRRPADCGTRPEAWPSATVTVVPVLPVAFVRSSRCAAVGLSTPAVQISAFWDAGLEPVDVAMSYLVPAAHPCAEAVAAAVAQCAPIPAAARHAPISRAVGDGSWAEAGGAIVAALVHGRIEYSSTLLSGQADGRARLSEFRGAVFVGGFSYADTLDSAKVRRPLNYSTIPCDRREYARVRCMLGLAGPGRSCSH